MTGADNLAQLREQVIRSPDDMDARLAYADAVEAADPERAELIRIQIAKARRYAAHWPLERIVSEDGTDWISREQGMINRRGAEWAADLPTLVSSWHYLRGFVEIVSLDAAAFLATAPEIYRRAPVLHLNLSGVLPVASDLFASPQLRRIRSLYLCRQELGDDEAAEIARSPHLGELEWLNLSSNHIGQAGLEALAASDRLPRLGYLAFQFNAVDDPTPRFADEWDADTLEAKALQQKYGPREWLSARPRAVWPPYRDAVWKQPDD